MTDTKSGSSKLLPFRRRDTDRTKGAASSTGPAMLEVLHTYEHDLQVCETYVTQLGWADIPSGTQRFAGHALLDDRRMTGR